MMRFPVNDDGFDDDDEIGVVYNPDGTKWVPSAPKKSNLWIIVGGFLELIGDLFKCFGKFFDTLTEESLAKYRYEQSQHAFQQQASREIEMLTSGDYDAATTESIRSKRSGTSLEED